MPLYVAEYKKDTGHLSTEQHGAYMLLIMHYWATGGLPDDDAQLARITCMSLASWKRTRPIIVPFFHDGWKHKRIDRELQHTEEVAEKYASRARHAAETRWSKHPERDATSNASSTTQAIVNMPISPSQSHIESKLVGNFQKVGERKATGWTPPKHGAQSAKHRTIYIHRASDDWPLYVAAMGREPSPDEHGGFWFPICGSTAIPPPKRQQVRA